MKFTVSVEKRMTATGTIEVEAESAEDAIQMVQDQIDGGELQTTAVEWDDPEYDDGSFTTTGDAD